ncbi:MAG: LysR family transcriptional regulator [Proteobacteria bacterium]|nr:LysR family transcriptional regulator [Pseudomonadota bacterium]
MDWDKLRTFYAVVQAGSFTQAGENLSLSQSAVSRQILGLEESLHVSLFHRHQRGLVMTEQGEILYKAVKEIFAKLAMTESLISENKDQPRGMLKITTTVAFGALWLVPHLDAFMNLYPEIQVDLILDDRELDLTRREADVGIRIIPSRSPELIQRKIMSYGLNIYAAQGYLKKKGTPTKLQDLKNHALISFSQGGGIHPVEDVNWILNLGLPRGHFHEPSLSINDLQGMMIAIQKGIGIGVLPEYLVSTLKDKAENTDEELIRLLPEIPTPQVQAYYVYPEELRNSKRISVFRDFLIAKIAECNLMSASL